MDDGKLAQNWTTTKKKLFSFPFRLPWNLQPSPSLTRLLLALTASHSLILPGTLDSFLTQNCPWRTTSYKSAKLLISSLNALVQSAGFALKTQPRLLLLPIFSHGLTTAIVSSWVHLILSSNLYRKFRTLLQDLFSWHPVTTTQHLSWKNCTGFPFQNVLSIKSLVCVSVL